MVSHVGMQQKLPHLCYLLRHVCCLGIMEGLDMHAYVCAMCMYNTCMHTK